MTRATKPEPKSPPDATLAEGPLPTRPVPEKLVNLILNDHRYPANDPCTYLG